MAQRQLTGRKQRAIERARVREVKAIEPVQQPKSIEKVTPTEKKIPWRAPRSKNKFDPGTYACQTIFYGICGLFFLPIAIIVLAVEPVVGLYFLIFPIVFIIGAIQSFKNSRGGW